MSASSAVEEKLNDYPTFVRPKLTEVRDLILKVADEEGIARVDESLKWGQPSFAAPKGSPIRFDWSESDPDTFAIYFVCTTKLVETFQELYGDVLNFEGNRAIRLRLKQRLPKRALKHCLGLALNYHKLKHLPLLGA